MKITSKLSKLIKNYPSLPQMIAVIYPTKHQSVYKDSVMSHKNKTFYESFDTLYNIFWDNLWMSEKTDKNY